MFDQSFHLFPCISPSWQPEGRFSSWTGCPHRRGQGPNLPSHGGEIPQRRSWEYQERCWEDERNPESQQRARSHCCERNRNGTMNYVTHRLHCRGGSRTVHLRRSVGAAPRRPCRPICGPPVAELRSGGPALLSPALHRLPRRTGLPAVALRQAKKDINNLLLNIPMLIA